MMLGRDVFIALAAVAWADGNVSESEAEALVGAAEAHGLVGEDIAAVRRALREHSTLDALNGLTLDPEERSFVYGMATWLTWVDGKVTGEEAAALAHLAKAFGMSQEDCEAVTTATVMSISAGLAKHDVTALAAQLRDAAVEA